MQCTCNLGKYRGQQSAWQLHSCLPHMSFHQARLLVAARSSKHWVAAPDIQRRVRSNLPGSGATNLSSTACVSPAHSSCCEPVGLAASNVGQRLVCAVGTYRVKAAALGGTARHAQVVSRSNTSIGSRSCVRTARQSLLAGIPRGAFGTCRMLACRTEACTLPGHGEQGAP